MLNRKLAEGQGESQHKSRLLVNRVRIWEDSVDGLGVI